MEFLQLFLGCYFAEKAVVVSLNVKSTVFSGYTSLVMVQLGSGPQHMILVTSRLVWLSFDSELCILFIWKNHSYKPSKKMQNMKL